MALALAVAGTVGLVNTHITTKKVIYVGSHEIPRYLVQVLTRYGTVLL